MSDWPEDPAPTRLDPTQGPRAEIYAHFRRFAQPWFTLSSRVQVSLPAHERFGGLLWGVLAAANQVPELRRRIVVQGVDEWVEEHPRIHATCTIATDAGGFLFCPFPYDSDRDRFLQTLPERIHRCKERGRLLPEATPNNMLYLSTLPWVDVRSVQHAWSGDPLDSVPRFLWGRVEDGQVGVSVTAHHSLVDGRHIAQFLRALESRVS